MNRRYTSLALLAGAAGTFADTAGVFAQQGPPPGQPPGPPAVPPGQALQALRTPVTLPVTGTVFPRGVDPKTAPSTGEFEGQVTQLQLSGTGKNDLQLAGVLTGVVTQGGQSQRVQDVAFKVGVLQLTEDATAADATPATPAFSHAAGAHPAPGAGDVVPIVASLAPSAQAVCDILFLDLQPLSLDLLGLQVLLSRVTLDVNALPGAGNLLGNPLCALVGLLDSGPLGGLLGQVLQNLLTAINQLLNGLLSG
jgi:hypothetical protein